ncbi:hypothetical protein IGS75_00870 [Gluconobacter sphaericus]|nr:hypothetical protein IGS75_00870 [Gluconobacter sphaericus]
MLKVAPMFDVVETEFSWEAPWSSLEVKNVAQDFFYWLLTNVFRGPTDGTYTDPDHPQASWSLLDISKAIERSLPRDIGARWSRVYFESPNFSDRKIDEIIERLTLRQPHSITRGPHFWAQTDALMELLFARTSFWSDALTLDDLLPQLTSGRMIQVYDEYRKTGLPLNVIAEHVLFYKKPIRSDEQRDVARALRDLGWTQHRTAQARLWIAPPDFPSRDRNKPRWHHR